MSEHCVFNGASASGTNPLRLISNAAKWSYALEIPFQPPFDAGDGTHIVRVTGRVMSGSVAIGILLPDRRTIQGEIVLTAPETGTWEVVAGTPAAGSTVMFRVACDAPVVAEMEIAAIDFETLTCQSLFTYPAREHLVTVPEWNRYYGEHGSTAERLRAHCHDRLETPRDFPWLFGLRLMAYPRDQISRAVFSSGLYEPATMLALQRLVKTGATVIDGGANGGLFALACAAWAGPAGRILAFEPSSREYARLREHVQLNRLTTVQARQQALSSAPGRAVLQVADRPYSGLNTLGVRLAYDSVGIATTEQVEVTTVDHAAAEIDCIDVIKLDVEGSEYDALLGASATLHRCRPAIVFEANTRALASNGRSLTDLRNLLAGHGYALFAIQPDSGLKPAEDLDDGPENFVALAAPPRRAD